MGMGTPKWGPSGRWDQEWGPPESDGDGDPQMENPRQGPPE